MSTRGILALCAILAIVGWLGLSTFTYQSAPDVWNQVIATAILWPTLVATFLPLLHWLHQRHRPVKGIVRGSIRQSILAATFVTLCLWLRILGGLTWISFALLFLLFVVTEVLLAKQEDQG